MTPDEIAAIHEWLLILEARDLELPEFHAMQLKVAKATHVMLDRIAALEAELADWSAEARLLADKLMERDAECIAEYERREAAEALLQAGRDVMAVIHGDGGHYREAHGDRKAADDAINIIYKLRADLNDARIELNRMRAGEMPGGWTAELESQIAARHAERERRKAAEAILRDAANCIEGHWLTLDIDAHFARYKD